MKFKEIVAYSMEEARSEFDVPNTNKEILKIRAVKSKKCDGELKRFRIYFKVLKSNGKCALCGKCIYCLPSYYKTKLFHPYSPTGRGISCMLRQKLMDEGKMKEDDKQLMMMGIF
jgi:hypothetical protein